MPVDRARLGSLVARERASYAATHPGSSELFQAANHLFGRVPMTWMAKWSGGFPLYLERASGNRIVDVDGHEYVDFALGDTGGMAGHSPKPVVDAVAKRLGQLGRSR
jgi:glutamate-1-semialdehyde 2,1-aminomutase